ncbi:ATP-binding protein [Flavobacterium sp. WV_118_3]|uniref:ATP-binding protein n=1 Tax=Flavobacterium sp. WV_118_3 TaxID=3151764 RepID=UPI0012C01E26|nr:hypothetical protein [Flavobacterium sp.]
MRIAIFGAHNVGKTTLVEELLKHLPEYTFEPEPYRQLEASGYEFSEKPTIDDFIEQFNYSAKRIPKSEDDVLFDRCVLDILAYIHVLNPRKNIQSLYQTMQSLLSEIDLFVFVPIEKPDLIAGHESDLPKLRSQVNDLLLEWIDDLGIEVTQVRGTLSNRRNQVLAGISE